ncbi:uncharacterized protein [Periplaneta americana]|uniref:uncharacterized protein n=1 Tax=Periplaneta americana TaxID=6978 RepID=UPI0037E82156
MYLGLVYAVTCLVASLSAYSAGHLRLLGSKCSHDQECLADVTYSRCQAGRCACLPYYAQYNQTVCVQSTLLGFNCLVKEQCSMKVANSMCLHGTCRCESGFLQFRRHTCLSPASPGDVCYSDAHCRLWDSDTHCDFLIPNLFGRCQCSPPMKQRGNTCIKFNFPTADASGPSAADTPSTSLFTSSASSSAAAATWVPVPSASTFTQAPTERLPVASPSPSNPPSPSAPLKDSTFPPQTLAAEAYTTLSVSSSTEKDYSEKTPEETQKPTLQEETTTQMLTPSSGGMEPEHPQPETSSTKPEISTTDAYTSIPLLLHFSTVFAETSSDPSVTSELSLQPLQMLTTQEDDTTETVISSQSTTREEIPVSGSTTPVPMASATVAWTRVRGVGEGMAVTLGLPCLSDLQCQNADPGSRCLDGVCDCVIKNNGSFSCGAGNSGCYKGTFQCRSTGVCISWFFVCDGRQDCPDGSDEECRSSQSCPPQAFKCGEQGGCVSRASRCDGTADCPLGEDELHCNATHSARGCPERTFRCADGRCLPEYEFCNAMVTCRDGSDEPRDACKARTKRRKSGYCPFRCANGRCRSDAIACSGRDGCGDGSDEARCSVCRCPMAP